MEFSVDVSEAKGGYKVNIKGFAREDWNGEHITETSEEVKDLVSRRLSDWLEGKHRWKKK